jgi:hypothetical protein
VAVALAVRAVTFAAVRALVMPFALATMRVAGLGAVLPLCQSRRDVVHMARRRAVRVGVLVLRPLRRLGVLRTLGMLGMLGVLGVLRMRGVLGVLGVLGMLGVLRMLAFLRLL